MSTTDHAFFYNSVDGDRVYDADSFEYWLKKFFTTGVFTGDCAVSPTSGMGIQMAAGYANVDGKVKFFENASSFTLSTANPSYDRIDTVVIERNDSDRDITAKVVTGTASASPTATAPVRTGGVYQLVVAQIYVAAGVTSIAAADITDKRTDTSVCGYVITACQTPDFTELYSQFTDAFETWFDAMKGQLTEDAAGNLQTEIDNLGDDYVKHSAAQTLTDAQKLQARANIDAVNKSVFETQCTAFENNKDANNYTTPGVYGFGTGCSNVPADNCILFVMVPMSGTQIYMQFATNKSQQFYREYRGGAWTVWRLVSGTLDVTNDYLILSSYGNISQLSIYKTAGYVSIAFVLTLTQALTAGTSYNIANMTMAPATGIPVQRSQIGGSNLPCSNLMIDSNLKMYFTPTNNIAELTAFWLNYQFLCAG